ncbi:hypothetical protein D9611_006968 [Ephemerocybe angulata]|uniref:Major facilitator superfamily (MFS) profile domain-containing protein n=1 Tax=Ephemerocybe angulata TaxID=980116 RepID=A0A8H5B057_9AGAR|nr:hypothetical protein D9611_006968 [Tulosesus angulatus]
METSRLATSEDDMEMTGANGTRGPAVEVEEVSDGGLRAWLTVAGVMLVQMAGFGYCSSYGVFQDYYTRVYITNASPSAISWVGSLSAFLLNAAGLITGPLYDRGYFSIMFYSGYFLSVLCLYLLSLAKPNHLYQVFLSQGLGFGIAGGLINLPTFAILSQHFKHRQAQAMIIAGSGTSIGALVYPLILNYAFTEKVTSFPRAARLSASFTLMLLSAGILLIREKKTPRNASTTSRGRPRILETFIASMKDVPFLCFSMSLMMFTAGIYYPAFYLQLDAVKHRVDEGFISYLYTIMNSMCIIGGLLPLLFVKSIGVEKMIAGSAMATAASVFAMLGLKDLAGTAAITVVFGFFIGAFFTLLCPATVLLTRDPRELGARLGFMFTFCAIGSLVGPPIQGALLSENFVWWKPAVFSGVVSSLGALGFAMVPVLTRRSQQPQNVNPESTVSETK